MAKQIILYNLASHVTDERYREYVVNEKGPLLDSLGSVRKFELVKVVASMTGRMPYRYVGILHIDDLEEFQQKDAPSKKFQDFQAKWMTMVNPDFQIFMGEEVY
jgi:hypothetical protein